MRSIVLFLFFTFWALGCRQQKLKEEDEKKPKPPAKAYSDKKYLLTALPDNFYNNKPLSNSFSETPNNAEGFSIGLNGITVTKFNPLGANNISKNYEYTHIYSNQCVYHTSDSTWKYAEVAFPNTCLTKDFAYANVQLHNSSVQARTIYLRLFYQNTSYWYRTDDSIDLSNENFIDNYYGMSDVQQINVAANSDTVFQIPYTVGMNPKHEFDYDPSKDPARPGNYEFLLLFSENKRSTLLNRELDLKKLNPFAVIKKDELEQKKIDYSYSYIGSHKFKFVFLDEYFDGTNDLTAGHIYDVKQDGKEKALCDTCTGWFRSVISEHWSTKTYFDGFIQHAPYIKASYGIRKANTVIDSNGINFTIPKSTRGNYQKTWGELTFGPSFKYGHLTVRAKFAQMFTNWGTPNGIVHNLWLYQRDRDRVDTTNPYHQLVNSYGDQPFEIDFEMWSSQENVNTMWDDNAFINYSIVDYMRDANVKVKPSETKNFGVYKANRLNDRQLNIPGENLPRSFFNDFHTYELYWYPDQVRFLLDGKETAVITNDMAKIPDKYLFLWLGSPIYQDGTYYEQSQIPFLKYDKHSLIDYIRIE